VDALELAGSASAAVGACRIEQRLAFGSPRAGISQPAIVVANDPKLSDRTAASYLLEAGL
jgi:hypothetical protein